MARSGKAAASRASDAGVGLVGASRGHEARASRSRRRRPRPGRPASSAASPSARQQYDDRVDRPEHAEERPSAAAIVGRAGDEPRDLDELDEDAADPGQRGHGAERRERVVAGLDLDLGQRLQERRLADVRRPDEGDLGRPLAPDGDGVAMDGARPDPGVLDLGEERLAEVRVRTVPVVRQLGAGAPGPRGSALDPPCR